jgi:hypothetical protein
MEQKYKKRKKEKRKYKYNNKPVIEEKKEMDAKINKCERWGGGNVDKIVREIVGSFFVCPRNFFRNIGNIYVLHCRPCCFVLCR